MAQKRCPGCGRTHDAEVLTCDCGTDLRGAAILVHADAGAVRGTSRWFPRFCLGLGAFLAIVGVFVSLAAVVGILAGLYRQVEYPMLTVVESIAGAICGMAMFYVFQDVRKRY